MDPPSVSHAKAGATVIANCSASDETTGKAGYRETLIAGQSARLSLIHIFQVIAGNVATGEATRALIEAGVDAVKVGIGP